jgi:hypothetical protein
MEGWNSTTGGYAIASSCVLKLVRKIQTIGNVAISAYVITTAAAKRLARGDDATTEYWVVVGLIAV